MFARRSLGIGVTLKNFENMIYKGQSFSECIQKNMHSEDFIGHGMNDQSGDRKKLKTLKPDKDMRWNGCKRIGLFPRRVLGFSAIQIQDGNDVYWVKKGFRILTLCKNGNGIPLTLELNRSDKSVSQTFIITENTYKQLFDSVANIGENELKVELKYFTETE